MPWCDVMFLRVTADCEPVLGAEEASADVTT
jgi:hypothetical protein